MDEKYLNLNLIMKKMSGLKELFIKPDENDTGNESILRFCIKLQTILIVYQVYTQKIILVDLCRLLLLYFETNVHQFHEALKKNGSIFFEFQLNIH